MRVNIQRIDNTLPLPTYQTSGAAAFDLYARETTVIPPHSLGLVPANLIIEVPEGYMLITVPRSSTPRKKGLSVPHGIGIIDQDYHGPEDEIKMQLFNFTDTPVTLERGERICQATFVPIEKVEWEEMTENTAPTRGGYGSTG